MCVLGLGLGLQMVLLPPGTIKYIPRPDISWLCAFFYLAESHGVSFVLVEPFVHVYVANLLLSFGVVPLSFVSEISSWCSCSFSLEVISNFVVIIP